MRKHEPRVRSFDLRGPRSTYSKTLKKDALEKYEMNSLEAIITQVYNGKNAMPKFGGRLTDAQIEDVATYVLSQAEKGW